MADNISDDSYLHTQESRTGFGPAFAVYRSSLPRRLPKLMKNPLMRSLANHLSAEGIEDVLFLDMRKLVGYTDYMVVATCPKKKENKQLIHSLMDFANEHNLQARIETDRSGAWSVIDMGDTVIHLFSPLARDFYRLDSLWGMAPKEKFNALRHAG